MRRSRRISSQLWGVIILGVVAIAGMIAIAAGCGTKEEVVPVAAGGSGTVQRRAITKIAIATPGSADDLSWNQRSVEGARQAAEEAGVTIEVADASGFANVPAVLARLASGGADLIIAHARRYRPAAIEAATELGVPILAYGNLSGPSELAANISVQSEQGAYLAGVLAARMTRTSRLGIVISAVDTDWFRQAGGFVAGARSVNPIIQIRLAQLGQAADDDAARGFGVTSSVIKDGVDVVFGMGNRSANGMLRAVAAARPPGSADKVWFIDTIGDRSSLDTKGVLLTSVLYDFSGAFKQAIDDVNVGFFAGEHYLLHLGNGGISLLRTPGIPDDVWQQVEKARLAIVDGGIEIPVKQSRKDVERLIEH